jgi:hypothetical protein
MDEVEAKQRVTDALITKMIQALELKRVEALPVTVYGFNAEDDNWFLFVINDARRGTGAAEYVAINRTSGAVRFLGELGE